VHNHLGAVQTSSLTSSNLPDHRPPAYRSRMRKFLGFAIAVSCPLVLITSPSYAFDSTPPKVTSATVSTNTIPSTGGSVTVTVKVHTNSGLGGNPVTIAILSTIDSSRTLAFGNLDKSDSNSGLSYCVPAASATVNTCPTPTPVPINTDPTFSKTFVVRAGLMPGIYQLIVFSISDAAQNHSNGFYNTGVFINYGDYVVATTSPTPIPSTSDSPRPTESTSPNPIPTVALRKPVPKPKTISCVKGKAVKKVVAIKPVCPSGYKIKK
jgi:hypothetical protein